VTLFGALGMLGTVAHANDNALRGTFTNDAPKIVKDEQALKKALAKYAHGHARPLVRALHHEVVDLDTLRSQLKREAASSVPGARAKSLVITGLRLMASAYAQLRIDIQAAHGGPVSQAQVNVAVSMRTRGRTKLLAGAKLFGSLASAPARASAPSLICGAACAQRLLKAFSGTQSLGGTPSQEITKALT
jgi:hypothetical protein